MENTEVKVKFQRIANAVVTSFVVGVSPVLSTRCRELYGRMYRRLQWVYKHHAAAVHKHKISYNELILGLVVFLFILNGVLFTKVVTSHDGKALEAEHIRNFRRTFPNARGHCTQGYELSTRGNSQLSVSVLGKSLTLLRNIAFRLATGMSVHRCRPCNAGSSKVRPASSCLLCSPGNYQPGRGAGWCTRCPVGSYQTSSGAVTCDVCPAGFHQPSEGGTDCIQCPEFTYQPRNGSSECIPCSESQQSLPDSCENQAGGLLEGIARDSPLACTMDRSRQDQQYLHQTLGSEEEQTAGGERGGFFSGFLPDFDKLSGLLNGSSGGDQEEEEEGDDVDIDHVITEQVAEDQGPEKSDEPSVKPEEIGQEDEKGDSKEEEVSSDTVEAVDETSKLESDLPVEDAVSETDVFSISEDDGEPLEDSDTAAGEVIELNDEATKSDTEPLLNYLDDDNTAIQKSIEEEIAEIAQSSSLNDIEVYETQEGVHLKVEESDDLIEDEELNSMTAIETPENTEVETVKDHDYSSDDIKQDIKPDVAVIANDQPKPKPILPMRNSDHPILQDIVAKINKSIETPKQPITAPKKYSNPEDKIKITIGGTNTEVNDEENIIAADEEPVDTTEDIETEVTEDVEIAKIPEAVDVSDEAAQDTSENLKEMRHETESDQPDSSSEKVDDVETADDDGFTSPSVPVDNELPDCDLPAAVLNWYYTNNITQLEGLKLLISDQFTAFWNHVLRLLDSDLPLFFIPLFLSLVVTYVCLMSIALHMLTASVGNSNVFTMFSLVAEMVFLASLALLDDKISKDRALVTVSCLYITSSITACLSGLDQISKACPNMMIMTKSSLIILSVVASLCGGLFIVDCQSIFSGKAYLATENATTVQLLCGMRLLPIPAVLARIDCEISRSPTRRVQGVHKIDLVLETLKLLLAVQILINHPTFLQLIVYLSVMVGLHGMELLLWELVISSHVTRTAAGSIEEEEEEEVTEFTEIRKLVYSTAFFTRVIAGENAVLYHNFTSHEEEGDEEGDQQTILKNLLDDGIEIDKSELTFDRARLHSNRDMVLYINKAPIEEMVSFTSENECKLYLAQMTGSCESLERIESVLEEVRRDSQKTNSESSNEDYIIIPKIVVECGDYPRELAVDCLCVDERDTTLGPERRRCRSADSGCSQSSTDLPRLDRRSELLSEQEREERRCQSSLSSFGSGSCASCRKTKL